MAMQTIPSRLTIWTSFKGLPTASPFFRAKRNDAAQFGCAVLTDSASHAKRNDAARRSDGTRKFQSPWGGTLGQPHGLFNLPVLVRTTLADLLAHIQTFSRHLYSPDGLSLFSCIYPFSSFAPLRRSSCCENKKSGVCATFLRLRTLFCPFKSKTGCRSADLLRFCA